MDTLWNGIYRLAFALVAGVRREEGQTMAEYGLLLAAIAVIVLVAALFLGGKISTLFSQVGVDL